ncbi:PREDICTED: uncharacterized protein LOC105537834 [Mandrillus leucophaeus]|uniref:uncharacterized protein LOC105537834 n=1 Tax=Mandrillus leucophaeus TaxID=9568 RepID=UPI0005F50F92|nr:PREDICTED: uncharacterized protein LOC105537834 [Mandrillus leucophaeus]
MYRINYQFFHLPLNGNASFPRCHPLLLREKTVDPGLTKELGSARPDPGAGGFCPFSDLQFLDGGQPPENDGCPIGPVYPSHPAVSNGGATSQAASAVQESAAGPVPWQHYECSSTRSGAALASGESGLAEFSSCCGDRGVRVAPPPAEPWSGVRAEWRLGTGQSQADGYGYATGSSAPRGTEFAGPAATQAFLPGRGARRTRDPLTFGLNEFRAERRESCVSRRATGPSVPGSLAPPGGLAQGRERQRGPAESARPGPQAAEQRWEQASGIWEAQRPPALGAPGPCAGIVPTLGMSASARVRVELDRVRELRAEGSGLHVLSAAVFRKCSGFSGHSSL